MSLNASVAGALIVVMIVTAATSITLTWLWTSREPKSSNNTRMLARRRGSILKAHDAEKDITVRALELECSAILVKILRRK